MPDVSPTESPLPADARVEAGDGRVSGERESPAAASAATGLTASAGDLLADKYRLEEPLGQGGMGQVWLAHDEALDVRVAVKIVRADLGASKSHVGERMLKEARAAASLSHPAIVRVTDFGKTNAGDAFFVMELLRGKSLADAIDTRGRMSPVDAVRTLLPIAHALLAAHEKNIVHRDVKPENILLAEQGGTLQPKLIDFGVAKLKQRTAERATAAGALLGSPGYMSPEQAKGEAVDARSDIWSFCVVLYETMTGELPFRGEGPYALIRAIADDEPTPLSAHGVADPGIAAIISSGLTKPPDERYESMSELGRDLARWLLDNDVTEDICGLSIAASWLRGSLSDEQVDSIRSAQRERASLLTISSAPSAPPAAPSLPAPPPPAPAARRAPALLVVGLAATAVVGYALWPKRGENPLLPEAGSATSVASGTAPPPSPTIGATAFAPPEIASTAASAPAEEISSAPQASSKRGVPPAGDNRRPAPTVPKPAATTSPAPTLKRPDF